jgi:hypothetical protein
MLTRAGENDQIIYLIIKLNTRILSLNRFNVIIIINTVLHSASLDGCSLDPVSKLTDQRAIGRGLFKFSTSWTGVGTSSTGPSKPGLSLVN